MLKERDETIAKLQEEVVQANDSADPGTGDDTTTGEPEDLTSRDSGGDHTVEGPTKETELMQTMTELLKAQRKAMEAQVQATAVQHLPRLCPYSGEKEQDEDDGFERWLELFKERAKLAGWSSEQRLYQLKLLLVKNAGQVFRLLAKDDQSDYDKATQALHRRFRRVDV